MNILASHFNTKSLLKYALPTILMMMFMSAYTIVDGIFVANLVGEDALAAVNIVWPVFNVVMAIGLMFATGGTAIMGRLMGEKKEAMARSFLSLLYLVAIGLGILLTTLIQLFPHHIVLFLGVETDLSPYAMAYLQSLGWFVISSFLQIFVQSFFVLAGRPSLGFFTCFVGGISNMILDYFLISPHWLNLGITGAGIATGVGFSVPAVAGLLYFSTNRRGSLYFSTPKFYGKMLGQGMFNGLSELVSQLSTAITTLIFNLILLHLAGKAGVASITIILYVQLMQTALYFGYSIGVAPIISYKYGARDFEGLQQVLQISLRFIGVVSLVVIAFSLLFDDFAVGIFISPTSSTFSMAKEGLRLFSISYLFMGINVFMSSMFTALSNGAVSATLSFTRTLVFLLPALLLLPQFWGLPGVWLAVPLAELLAFILSWFCYRRYKQEWNSP